MLGRSEQAPIRLALVITTLEPGGAELCLTNLAIGLSQRGFDPAVFVLARRPPPSKGGLVDALDSGGVPCRFLGLSGVRQFPKAVWRLRAALQEQQPDMVQSFLYHANVIAAFAARHQGIPIVSGIRVAEPKKFRLSIERFATRRVDRIVCVSEDVARHMRRAGFDPTRLVVIPNSVRTEILDAASPVDLSQFGIPAAARVILYVGRLDRQKGIRWLVEQTPGLLNTLPTCHLLIVGDGPEQEATRQLIGILGVGDRVHLAGWQADVAGLLKAASLLILPSRWEGMPNVVLQAMACGLAVVCSQTHGMKELLGETFESQVFEFGDSASLVQRLSSILSEPKLATELGAKNRRRALVQFSPRTMLDRYERLYRELNGCAQR